MSSVHGVSCLWPCTRIVRGLRGGLGATARGRHTFLQQLLQRFLLDLEIGLVAINDLIRRAIVE